MVLPAWAMALASQIGVEAASKIFSRTGNAAVENVKQAGRDTGNWFRSGHVLSDLKSWTKKTLNRGQRLAYSMVGANEKVGNLDDEYIRVNTQQKFNNNVQESLTGLFGNNPQVKKVIEVVKDFGDELMKAKAKMDKYKNDPTKMAEIMKEVDFSKGVDAAKNIIGIIMPQSAWSSQLSGVVSYLTKLSGISSPAALAAIGAAELVATIGPLRRWIAGIGKKIWNGVKKMFGKASREPDTIPVLKFREREDEKDRIEDLELELLLRKYRQKKQMMKNDEAIPMYYDKSRYPEPKALTYSNQPRVIEIDDNEK